MRLEDIRPGQDLLFQRPGDAMPRLVKAKSVKDGHVSILPTPGQSTVGVRVNPDYLSPVVVPEAAAPARPSMSTLTGLPVYEFGGYRFVQTCAACPEQYDVYDRYGKLSGYVRLRWGVLSCRVPDAGGKEIYRIDNDSCDGTFPDDDVRFEHLGRIAELLSANITDTD